MLFCALCLRDRVGDARGLAGFANRCAHVDHVGAFGAFHPDDALECVQGRGGAVGRAAGVVAHKFGIVFEPLGLDHTQQHAVGHQNPNLALDQHDGCVVRLVGRTEIVADRAQIRRIDEDLRGSRVSVRNENHEQHRDED